MTEAAKVVHLIRNTSGYLDKLYLLKKNADVPGLREILRFIYNPYTKTGISAAKLNKALDIAAREPYKMGEEPFVSWQEMIKYLKTHQTGTDADLEKAASFISCTRTTFNQHPFTEELAKAIVTQDLQIGISAKSLNRAYGSNFIPTTGCMLGTNITDVPEHKLTWPCIVTEKLDGVRRLLVKENGVCRVFSRSGHEDFGLNDIISDAAALPDNRVYDGELLAIGSFANNIELRQATASRANIKSTKSGLSFNCFDMVPIEEFYAGRSEDNALTRKIILGATLMDESIQILYPEQWPKLIAAYGIHKDLTYIRPVPILGLVKSLAEIDSIVAPIWARGGEGVMLNTVNGLYEIKRSKALLKVKHVEEITLTVVDVYEGTGKYEDSMGGIVVSYKDFLVGVGSGFTDAMRAAIWAHPEKFVGRKVELDHFGESANKQGTVSLNCPIFKRFAGDEE